MTAIELLKNIAFTGGQISSNKNELIIDAPKNFLNETILINLKREKENILKILEIKNLINQASNTYGGDESVFLAEYIDDVTCEWSHDLDKALACFKNIAVQAAKIKGIKP